MRIALVTPGFSADDEDWCIPFLQDFTRALNRDHRVRVFAITYPHRQDDYHVKGVSVSSFGDGIAGRLALALRMRRTLRAIREIHEREPFDVLHGFWCDGGGVVTGLAARRLGLPNIVTVMGGELIFEPLSGYGKRKQFFAGTLGRFGALRADALTVSSSYHARRIRDEQPQLAPQTLVLGPDTNRFTPRGPTPQLKGDVPILAVGSLVPVKRHEDLLRALAQVVTAVPGVHLHMVGEGRTGPALTALVRELNLTERVTFHGHVPHHELPAYYRASSFCVLTSAFENHAMVVLEAAACGRLTIGTRVGVVPEFAPEPLCVSPGDVAGLARAISELARNSETRSGVAADLRDRVCRDYDLDRTLGEFVNLYRSCAG